ncbi:MAG: phosphatidate cytidylyltransferase [Planctomycetota bacterium]|jgi:phosphatidate cytidylyltransferase
MDWRTALDDPVFLRFLWICGGLLGAGAVLLGVARVAGRDTRHAWTSFRAWLVMVPLFLLAVFIGRTATVAFLTLVAILAFKEFARGTGLYRDWWMTVTAYIGIVGVALTVWVQDPTFDRPGWLGTFLAMPAYLIALVVAVPILRDRSKGQIQSMALATIGFLYIGWMFAHLAFLVNSPHAYGYLLYLVLAVEVNDIAAYVTGRLFGNRAIRPNISPNKTVAGSLGGLAVSIALPFCFRFALPHFTAPELVLTGMIVGIGGQLGDLSISVIKRDLGVKDMGALIPGHGGVLDRIDSLIFVAPIFFHTVHYFHGIYAA